MIQKKKKKLYFVNKQISENDRPSLIIITLKAQKRIQISLSLLQIYI